MVRRCYQGVGAPSDAGEQKALAALTWSGTERVLDLGIGAGRTTALLSPQAFTYVGVDISPPMLARARRAHPVADLRLGDARDLSQYADCTFDLVVFSFNGVDCLQHEERSAFFTGVHRVLAPGGRLLVSTLNLDGPCYRDPPAPLAARDWLRCPGASGKAKAAVYGTLRFGIGRAHLRRNASKAAIGEDWAWAPLPAHQYRFLVHFIRFRAQVKLLLDCGFEVETAWTNSGEQLDPTADRHLDDYAHLLCRRVPV